MLARSWSSVAAEKFGGVLVFFSNIGHMCGQRPLVSSSLRRFLSSRLDAQVKRPPVMVDGQRCVHEFRLPADRSCVHNGETLPKFVLWVGVALFGRCRAVNWCNRQVVRAEV